MNVLERMSHDDFEQVMFCHDETAGLRAIIAIHDTTLGPAVGGLRMHPYSSEADALDDLVRLSRAMTLKAAAAGLDLGGGCAVVLGDPRKDKSEALLRSFGRHLECLSGRLYVAEDVGTNVEDMETISQETRYVAGLRKSRGGSGDPATKAAAGIKRGISACLAAAFEDSGLRGRRIAIQGVGAVGSELARLLAEEGARVFVADRDPARLDKLMAFVDVEKVPADKLLTLDCDVLAPCALGGIITEELVPSLQCRIIAGSANNQLENERVEQLLYDRGIIYAPDFVINAGGLINVAEELSGYDENTANLKIGKLYQSIEHILQIARERSITSVAAARELAMQRIRLIREVRRTYLPSEH